MSPLDAALLYARAGLSVVPVAGDAWTVRHPGGTESLRKAPAYETADGYRRFAWKRLQSVPMGEEQIRRYFAKAPNVGVVFGAVSGHAELIDFDAPGLYEEWRAVLEENGHADLVARLYVQTSQTPGRYHVAYRCPDGVEPSRKLASRPVETTEISRPSGPLRIGLVETRGEGGYALVAPSEGYRALQGRLTDLPVLSGDERRLLLDAAAYLDRTPPTSPHGPAGPNGPESKPGSRPLAEKLSPADDFDRRGDWDEILVPHGWTRARTRDGRTSWVRPGKEPSAGASATTLAGRGGVEFLVVFSTNAAPLEPTPEKYGKFRAFAALNYTGTETGRQRAAARNLALRGYGTPLAASEPEEVREEKARVFRRMPWRELRDRPPKPMLVGNLLGEGDSAMIAGVRKGGKTAVVLNLILCMVGGRDFAAGRFPVARPLRVGYFTTEGLGSLHTRLEAANRDLGVSEADLEENLFFFPQLPQLFDRNAEEHVSRLVAELQEDAAGLDVVVLDTFAKSTLGAEENSNSEMSQALAALAKARAALGCASLLVHHANKAGDLRGASAIDGDLDVLTWVRWDEKTTGDRQFEYGFAKDLGPWPPIPFDLRCADPGVPGSIVVEWSRRQGATDNALQQLLRAMASDPAELWTVAQLRAATGLSANVVQSTLAPARAGRPGGPVRLVHPPRGGPLAYRLAGGLE